MTKSKNNPSLGFAEIVLGADAETIRAALEARIQIDGLLAERAEAYQKIAALEQEVENLIGEGTAFPFPDPPLPVFGYGKAKATAPKKKAPSRPNPVTAAPATDPSPPPSPESTPTS